MTDKASGFSGWLQGILEPLVRAAVDEAVKDLHDDIKADLVDLENNLMAQVNQLPGLVASQVEHVALDAEQVAQNVANSVIPMLQGLVDPGKIAQQVIQGVIGALPHFPGFGGHLGGEHETSAGSAQPTKAQQIRRKLQERQQPQSKESHEDE